MIKNYLLVLFVVCMAGEMRSQAVCYDTLYHPNSFRSNQKGIIAVDWNQDGAMDYAFIDQDSNKVFIHYRDPATRLFPGSPQPLYTVHSPFRIKIGKANSDNVPDLFILHNGTSGSDSVKILLADGTGGFSSVVHIGTNFVYDMAVSDVNRDGYDDVLITENLFGSPSTMYSYVNSGSNYYTAGTTYTAPSPIVSIAVADVDGDGDEDIFLGSQGSYTVDTSRIFVVLNTTGIGGTPFSFAYLYDYLFPVDIEKRLTQITAADYNGDGQADIAVCLDISNHLAVLTNAGGTFNAPIYYNTTTNYPQEIASADMDKDGDIDLVASMYYGGDVQVWSNDGSANFTLAADISTTTYYTSLCLADMDADNSTDILIASSVNSNSFDVKPVVIYNNTNAAIIQIPSGSGTYCPGTTAQVYAFSNNPSFQNITYDWNSGYSSNDTVSVVMNGTQSLTLDVTNQAGCVSHTFINLGVYSAPDVELGPDRNTCNSSAVNIGPFLTSNTLYSWTSSPAGFTSSSYTVSVAPASLTTYYLAATSTVTGCSASDSIHVSINNPTPSLTLLAPFTNHGCQGDTFQLANFLTAGGGTPPYTIDWWYGPAHLYGMNPTYTLLGNYTFSVSIVDVNGCAPGATTSFQILNDGSNTDLVGHVTTPLPANVDNGLVYAFRHQPGDAGLDTIAAAPLDGSGNYVFSALDNNPYLIKVIANTTSFPLAVPTYFGNEFQWDSSIVVNHGCTQIDTADIQVLEVSTQTGPGAISGYVFEGLAFGSARFNSAGGPPPHVCIPGGPLKGIDVKLGKNPGSGIQARMSTDSTGYYEFTNLPVQGYRIYVDIPNLPMDSTREVVLDSVHNVSTENNYIADSASVYITDSVVAVGINVHNIKYETNFVVYPNPARENLFVNYELNKAGDLTIELSNSLGQAVKTERIEDAPAGRFTHRIDAASLNLKAGVYFISITDQNKKYTQRLIVVE